MPTARPLDVLTWHVHGNYFWYLSQAPIRWFVPTLPGCPPGYAGRGSTFPFPDNVVEVPADELRQLRFDVVVHQSRRTWTEDRFRYLTEVQRRLPTVYLEHDPPLESPTNTLHLIHDADEGAVVVHVTSFNRLMWDNGSAPTVVIEHGVMVPPVCATLERGRGLVVVNDLGETRASSGRRPRGARAGASSSGRGRHGLRGGGRPG